MYTIEYQGEMAEWLKAAVLKTVRGESLSRVRIPLSPHHRASTKNLIMSLFKQAIVSIEKTIDSGFFNEQEKSYINEALFRLGSIEDRYTEVIRLNDNYLASDQRILEIRKNFSEEKVFQMLTEQAEIDSKLKVWLSGKSGIKVGSKTEISTFNLSELNDKKIFELHALTESIYHDLWTIKERLSKVDKYKKFNPSGVRDVRNHLIVHIDKPCSGATLYSFGIQTRGPVLRPVKPSTAKANHDNGIISNVEEFLNNLIKIFALDTIESKSEQR